MIPLFGQVQLRPLSLSDVEHIFLTIDAERRFLREWLPFVDATYTIDDSRAFVESVLNSDDKHFAIYDGDVFIGLVGLKDCDLTNKKAEIGYWLSEHAQGKGIITLSVRELLEYAFVELGFNRVQIKVAVENKKSRRIPEKLGFHLEGIERDGELLSGNTYTDLAVYSLLNREYRKLCK